MLNPAPILIYVLIYGSIYLLASLGFSIICGVLRIFHLGYEYVYALTVYLTWMFIFEFGLELPLALALMILGQFLFAFLLYKGIIVRYFEREEYLLTAVILVAYIVDEAINYRYPVTVGASLPTVLLRGTTNIGGVNVSNQLLIIIVVALLLTVAFAIFFLKSRIGMAMCAVSQNVLSARYCGVDTDKLFALAFILSTIPAIICVVLIAPIWSIEPSMGWPLLSTAILISVLGGLGNLKGCIVASYIIGFVYSIVAYLLDPRYISLAGLLVTLVLLLFKPTGLVRAETIW